MLEGYCKVQSMALSNHEVQKNPKFSLKQKNTVAAKIYSPCPFT